MNTTGKPYAGKPHVRFDEEAEERYSAPRFYSTARHLLIEKVNYYGKIYVMY
jgi:hypothetical protein